MKVKKNDVTIDIDDVEDEGTAQNTAAGENRKSRVWCTNFLAACDCGDPHWYWSLAWFAYLITFAVPLALISLFCAACVGILSLCFKKLKMTAQVFLLQACIPVMATEGVVKGTHFHLIVPFCFSCAFG